MKSDCELVVLERPEPGIIRLTLNRAEKRNALSVALRDAISDALDHLKADPELKCLMLTGAGEVFSAGFDLSEFQGARDDVGFHDRLWASSDRYHHGLMSFPLPVVCAVNGPALAGGLDTAVLCDLRIASEAARFGHPEASFGDVVYGPLHDLIGGAAARDLCLTGRTIGAAEALRLGLVAEVVAPGDLQTRSLETARTIARAPREILLRTKAKFIARAGIAFRHTRAL